MSVLGLAWRSLKQRRLSSILTAVSIALGVALTIAIMALRDGAESSYHDTARGYDVILESLDAKLDRTL
ncbi:MAG: ABC transporter permease, partial [Planctomycetota bacterium]|nr:ABC transporter permease [Planctomycetota bacterium]